MTALESMEALGSIAQRVEEMIAEATVEAVLYGKGIRVYWPSGSYSYRVEATHEVPFNEIQIITG